MIHEITYAHENMEECATNLCNWEHLSYDKNHHSSHYLHEGVALSGMYLVVTFDMCPPICR